MSQNCINATLPQSYRILVVEDSPDFSKLMQIVIESLNHTVKVVGTGSEALEACCHWEPDLVFMDFNLPDGNGEEFAHRIIRNSSGSPHVVGLTGYDESPRFTEALSMGIEFCIRKPTSYEALLELLSHAIDRTLGTKE